MKRRSLSNLNKFGIPAKINKVEECKLEYNARISSDRCNNRLQIDFALGSGCHRSSKNVVLSSLRHHDAPASFRLTVALRSYASVRSVRGCLMQA